MQTKHATPQKRRRTAWLTALMFGLLALGLAGCDDMRNQPRYEPLEVSTFFSDQRASRPLPAGAVPQGLDLENEYLYSGFSEEGELVESYPFEITRSVLERGRERYDIYCAPCHGLDGYGEGIIVQRGFAQPASLHSNRLRSSPAGHFYDVITNGYGQMYSYAFRVAPEDRWAITAYIRALQLSQGARPEDVPSNELQRLEAQP
jgi:hypothetical protein